MALRTVQIALATTPAVPLIVKGDGTGTTFKETAGQVGDPLPVMIQNNDATHNVTIGGPAVATEGGVILTPGETYPMSLVGETMVTDVPYAVSVSGTPSVTVQVGRQ